ncbi:hypothetical protein DITRI_Ditri18aG0038400 [Diplodiscus trichospermus]
MNQRKLLLNERVEVRQFEEGLRGSWHPGVVAGVSNLYRSIKYDELLCETGKSKLIESIPVTEAIEGLHSRRHIPLTYRGHIRPLPPSSQSLSNQKLGFGVCVDALFEDAWWEGVILDNDENASERFVYFPDESDECKFSVSQLRLAHEWDEFTGIWRARGTWILVQLAKEFEGDVPLACCVKKVWSSLRLNYGFMKMISEWTCGVRTIWRKYFMEVIQEIAVGSSRRNLANRKILAWMVRKKGNKLKNPGQANSQSSDTFALAGNCNNLKAVRSCRKGGDPLGKHKGRKRSVTSKLKHEELSTINKSTRKSSQDDKLCGEKKMTSGVSLMKSNCSIFVDESDHIPDHYTNANKEVCSSLSAQTKESGKLESEIGKQKSPIIHENEGDQFSIQSSGGRKTISYGVSLVQDNKSAFRSFKKHGQINGNLAAIFPDCGTMQASRQPFLSFIHKRKRSTLMRKRISRIDHQQNSKYKNPLRVENGHKKASYLVFKQNNDSVLRKKFSKKPKQADSKVEAIPRKEEKGLNVMWKEDDLVAGPGRHSLPFDDCGKKVRLKDMVSRSRRRKRKWRCRGSRLCDTICSVCHYGGGLIICDHCPCAYHLSCINLKTVPSENWFCPSCCCGLCGLRVSNSDSELFTKACLQCTRQYHVACLSEAQHLSPTDDDHPYGSFCSEACYKLCAQLHQLLGISNRTTVDGLSWTLMRSLKNVYQFPDMSKCHTWIKLSNVLRVIHECFEPVKEPHTKRDLVRDVVFSSG